MESGASRISGSGTVICCSGSPNIAGTLRSFCRWWCSTTPAKSFPDIGVRIRGLEKGFGGGVRLKTSSGVLLRLELGHSREGNVLHFKLGPAF